MVSLSCCSKDVHRSPLYVKSVDSGAKSCFFKHFWHHYRAFFILKVDDVYQLQENAAIQQIIDNKYLKSFKADKLKVIDLGIELNEEEKGVLDWETNFQV